MAIDPCRDAGPEGTAVVVSLPAEIDISNDVQVRGMLADALDRRPAVVIADGSQTTFCSGSGAARLLEAHYRAAAEGVQLRLVATAAEVRRILQLTSADTKLAIYPSLQAAVLSSAEQRMLTRTVVPLPRNPSGMDAY